METRWLEKIVCERHEVQNGSKGRERREGDRRPAETLASLQLNHLTLQLGLAGFCWTQQLESSIVVVENTPLLSPLSQTYSPRLFPTQPLLAQGPTGHLSICKPVARNHSRTDWPPRVHTTGKKFHQWHCFFSLANYTNVRSLHLALALKVT